VNLAKLHTLFLLIVTLAACSSLAPHYEQPEVSITSFSLDPHSAGATPQFNIGLRVINPNRTALPLAGMSYSVEIDGNRILSGVNSDLPRIPGFGSADITLQAVPDLFGSARLMNQLLSSTKGELDYVFRAKLDVGSLMPYLTIEEKGRFNLTAE
jgi:LEA14-like dessication related protein